MLPCAETCDKELAVTQSWLKQILGVPVLGSWLYTPGHHQLLLSWKLLALVLLEIEGCSLCNGMGSG